MARKPMVTRTFTTTKVTVLGMNIESCEPMNMTCTLAGAFKDEKKLMKAVLEALETDDFKPVKIVDKVEEETLYGMTISKFIAEAEILPPRFNETEDAE